MSKINVIKTTLSTLESIHHFYVEVVGVTREIVERVLASLVVHNRGNVGCVYDQIGCGASYALFVPAQDAVQAEKQLHELVAAATHRVN